jgi:hypothetical protein
MSTSDSSRIPVRVERGIYTRNGAYRVLVSEDGHTSYVPARTTSRAASYGRCFAARSRASPSMTWPGSCVSLKRRART